MDAIVAKPSASNTRLGKTALALHALGAVFLCGGIGTLAVLGVNRNESYTFLAFGAAAFLVLSLWALVLAARSYFANERAAPAFVVTLAVLFEFTAVPLFHTSLRSALAALGGLGWFDEQLDSLVRDCVPAASGLFFLIIGLGIPLARWLTRNADDALRDSLRRGCFCRIAGVTALVLSIPFFVTYSFLTLESTGEPALNVSIARHVPVWIGDRLEAAVNSRTAPGRFQSAMLYQGCVSADRLVTRLGDGNPAHFNDALHGLSVSYPQRLLPACLQISKHDHAYACAYFSTSNVVCAKATPGQLHAIISAGQEYKPQFRSFVIAQAAERYPELDFSEDILKFAAEDSAFRRHVASFDFDDPVVVARFHSAWNKLYNQHDWSSRTGLACVIPYLECPLTFQLKLFQQCLGDPDSKMRRAAMASACAARTKFNWSAADGYEIKAWLPEMLKRFDDPDIFIRRSAVLINATLLGASIRATPDDSALIELPGWAPSPPLAGEADERGKIRAASNEWLAKH